MNSTVYSPNIGTVSYYYTVLREIQSINIRKTLRSNWIIEIIMCNNCYDLDRLLTFTPYEELIIRSADCFDRCKSNGLVGSD